MQQAVDVVEALGRGTPVGLPPPPDDPDLPADSFRLPLEDVLDWVSRNAVVSSPYDRDASSRGLASPNSRIAPPPPPNFRAASHGGRYPKPRVPIIGLPHRIQCSRYSGLQIGRRQPCANGRLFPKGCGNTYDGSGRTTVPETEPTSPKVSCFGTVLPDRDQSRRHRGASAAREVSLESPSSSVATSASASAWEAAGFWASVLGFTCCRQRPGAAALLGEQASAESSRASTPAAREILMSVPFPEETVMAAPTPGLGGMRRFTSGRRTASWGGDLHLDVDAVDRSTRHAAAVFPGRLSVDSLADLERERESEQHGGAASA